jgi:hypothetical protein
MTAASEKEYRPAKVSISRRKAEGEKVRLGYIDYILKREQ